MFTRQAGGQARGRIPNRHRARNLDADDGREPDRDADSLLPYQLTWNPVSIPANYERLGPSLEKVASEPSGNTVRGRPRSSRSRARASRKWYRNTRIGIPSACPSSTGCRIPVPSRRLAPRRFARASRLGSRRRRPMRSRSAARRFQSSTNSYPAWTYASSARGTPFADVPCASREPGDQTATA